MDSHLDLLGRRGSSSSSSSTLGFGLGSFIPPSYQLGNLISSFQNNENAAPQLGQPVFMNAAQQPIAQVFSNSLSGSALAAQQHLPSSSSAAVNFSRKRKELPQFSQHSSIQAQAAQTVQTLEETKSSMVSKTDLAGIWEKLEDILKKISTHQQSVDKNEIDAIHDAINLIKKLFADYKAQTDLRLETLENSMRLMLALNTHFREGDHAPHSAHDTPSSVITPRHHSALSTPNIPANIYAVDSPVAVSNQYNGSLVQLPPLPSLPPSQAPLRWGGPGLFSASSYMQPAQLLLPAHEASAFKPK